ncbi:hypothetical protein FF38_08948 [Lucilia cuprina]|uniref:Uncharacterized protein n=1 Tax=Lucilia cuprina TaxID=7375 RepID=A0A0L0C532_LUCCU|nr:hypothetical protein CVS40_11313 [Lucilia cuprina]KNC27362.1 hypothetical protein FF38_08948 [Lucilia cuprina]
MWLNKFIIIYLIQILTTTAVLNKNKGNYKTLQTGTFYLNSERPLWILQDEKSDKVRFKQMEFKEKPIYENIKPLYYNNRMTKKLQEINNHEIQKRNYKNFKTKAQKRFNYFNNYQGLQLPRNYIPLRKSSDANLHVSSRRYQNSKFIQNLPVFDAVPGEEAYTPSRPIFIYTGNKGRMLLNTMLSKRKYPMQEPVPGQVLYPPQTLMFKPQPLVENFQQKINVTMIPFYAYEAIDPRQHNLDMSSTSSSSNSYSSSLSNPYQVSKKLKKPKKYSAFFSPQEVLSQPITELSQYHYQIEYTTNSPLTLEKPYDNHRLNNASPITTPLTTPLPHKKFEVTYNDGEDKFQITYEDDTPHLERPLNIQTTQFTTTQAPLPYESYNIDQNYYAFPLYTMSKLMEKEDNNQKLQETRKQEADVTIEQQRIEKYIDSALKEENDSLLNKSNEDTWFILNSRYKGPLKTNANNLHSSKYIQSSPGKLQDLLKKEIKPKETTKPTLQPQGRSLYGEHINFI